jgi:acetoacetyl-CoA synthetase
LGKILWTPSQEQVREANLTQFIDYVNERFALQIDAYSDLYEWSINNITEFWGTLWDYFPINASIKYDRVADNINEFLKVKWFPGAKLNFAENLLRNRDDTPAIIFHGEKDIKRTITHKELYHTVTRLAVSLRELGVQPGDHVAAYQPNLIETIIAMLASSSLGATWASCGAELGSKAVLDRIGQVQPKVLFVADGYFYKGKTINMSENIKKVVNNLPTVKKTVVSSYTDVEKQNNLEIPDYIYFDDFLSSKKHPKFPFTQLPFNHPGYVMFSSGTTGKPKSMVQGAGGVLLTQLRDLILHTDLKKEDRITYITSPSWMMWNWLTSALAVATIILYDGNPLYPDWGRMWELIDQDQISIFGTSASYLHHLHSIGAEPNKNFDLSSLRIISQTASPISTEVNEWMYRSIKKDMHFNSITGGSDLNAIFAGGCPILPVYAGEIQVRALGMRIEAYTEDGKPIRDQQAELVCENPSPSMPLYFWDDPDHIRYKNAYFDYFKSPGRLVWRHGDYIIIHSETGGMTVFGRSDSVLKPSGVRIGTSEIYNIVETFAEVADSLAIGQTWKSDQRIILFLKIASGKKFSDKLVKEIKQSLKTRASPRHVPNLILETPDIPYTFSMKKVESAVTNILNGRPVTNKDALTNPQSLEFFVRIAKKLNS